MTAVCPVCDAPQDEGLMCAACVRALEADLHAVPDLMRQLDVTISRQARIGGGAGKAGLASERTPVHLGAIEAADHLAHTLTTWARQIGPAFPPLNARMSATLMARTLTHDLNAIRRHPKAADLAEQIGRAVRDARRVIDRPQDRIYLGVCMVEEADNTCMAELYATPTASEVRCKVCGITHPVAERRAWLLRHAEDMLFTVREAARMVGSVGHINVTEAAIRGYLHRRRIAYRPGTNTIRLGDLLAVVVDESERRTA